ncbi:hypothetical protein Nepgr_016123 [Nepenthes gracilis]|uniref:MAPK kinase substrate protein At1g80180-like n=1 Tax=Nepenthes gracilis TaxID=150966 RepID=A0AAD3SPK9_NEPGR|nr:hypothetical protein Nepgr_016123 [Nepenthes gracilis]
MAGLQRSTVSFRRQGSSGLVWDDRFLSGELAEPKKQERGFFSEELSKANTSQQSAHDHRIQQEDLKLRPIRTDRSASGRGSHTVRKDFPAEDPPSPKTSGFSCCGGFGRSPWPCRSSSGKPSRHS